MAFDYSQMYLPQQQVLQVDGKASIDKMRMAPNSTLLADLFVNN